jgi:rubrerythrin
MKTAKKFSIKEIFALAVAAEARTGDLYREFQKIFSHDPAAVDFWKEMEADERLHEDTLQEMYETLSEKEKSSTLENPLFEKAEGLLKGISPDRILDSTITLDDAYETAYGLENSEVNTVMQFLVTEVVPSYKRHDFILAHVRGHVARLETFSRTVCDEECRRRIMAVR